MEDPKKLAVNVWPNPIYQIKCSVDMRRKWRGVFAGMQRIANLSDSGQRVFEARYAAKNEQGEPVESFEEAVHRLANTAALAEEENLSSLWEDKFAEVIGSLLFIPSTPIWANMGKTDRPWQPGACFVLSVEDSLDSMYETLKETAMVFKSGGGVGYNFSTIRPRGSLVSSTKGQASGVVELIRLYDASSAMVMQGGVRRGASMGILNVNHPEVIDFIECKRSGEITRFNLSVGITDVFMEAVAQNTEWPLVFNGEVHQVVQAQEIWDLIAEAAHACGDPGVIFLDRLQRDNPVPSKVINATNPCGEQPLSPGESCLLGSINLLRLLKAGEEEGWEVNWDLLDDVVQTSVRFLDNIIDVADYPLEFIAESTRATRKIGLGYTGLHDMLIKMELAYDSEAGRRFAGKVLKSVQESAHAASRKLAEERGCFPDWPQSVFSPDDKRRNAACITVAPTGSVTTIAGCEGYGIEPIFAVAYTKATDIAGSFEVFSPLFIEACQKYNIPAEVMSEVAQRGGCQDAPGIPVHIANIFKGAQEISPEDHILMQAEVQKCVDNATSKTINLPSTATIEDVQNCYRLAYDLNLKGITIFRDGCKQGVITVGKEKQQIRQEDLRRGEILPRPINAHGVTHRLDSGCGKIYLTVNYQPESGEILETFITTGSDGGCLIYTEATSRLISLAIRGGISVTEVIEQLQSTHSCPAYQMARGRGRKVSPGKSCASAIAKKLVEISTDLYRRCNGGAPLDNKVLAVDDIGPDVCEICGQRMTRAEGCFVCENCGFSKC